MNKRLVSCLKLGAGIFVVVALLALCAAAFVRMAINLPHEQQKSTIENSIQDWGEVLTGELVSTGPIESSGNGPLRLATYRFDGKFGEVQTSQDWFEIDNVKPTIKVYQQADSGKIFLGSSSDSYGDTKTVPYESGTAELVNLTIVGLLATALLAWGCWKFADWFLWFLDSNLWKPLLRRLAST